MEHTKGPWKALPTGDTLWKITHGKSEFAVIATTAQGNDEANARVLALAPELLEQLQYWENIISNSTNMAIREALQPWMGRTRELLAQAKVKEKAP